MILLYDENLNLITHPIDDYFSMEWVEAWEEPAEWQIQLPVRHTDKIFAAAYLYAKGIGFGIVENIRITQDSLQASGRGLEAFLDHFVVTQERTLTGRAESLARGLITQYARGVGLEEEQGIRTMAAQYIEAGSLMDAVYGLLCPRGMSYRLAIEDGKMLYRTIKGENRTARQNHRAWVQFSESLGNLRAPQLEQNTRDEKTRVILRNSVTEDGSTTTTLYTYDFGG